MDKLTYLEIPWAKTLHGDAPELETIRSPSPKPKITSPKQRKNNDEKLKYFQSKPKMATRQCSSSVINSISNDLPELIGGSADLSGSNNTKTDKAKVITSKNFNGNYIH